MNNEQYILAVDIGTSSLKVVLFKTDGIQKAISIQEYNLEKKAPNIVEVDVEIYWKSFINALNDILKNSNIIPKQIISIGVTSQGETLILLDKNNKPLRKAIVWLDNRATAEATEINAKFSLEQIYKTTGQHEVVPGLTAPKIVWLRKNEPELFKQTKKFLMVEDYLIFRLTGKFATDHALNSSTLYYDIQNFTWWDDMLEFLEIKKEQLPTLLYSGEVAGYVNVDIGLDFSTKVTVAPIDQISGAVGAGNIDSQMITETTGTALAICATVNSFQTSEKKDLGVYLHANKGNYVLLPWVPTAGIIFKWFRDELGGNKSYKELEELAKNIKPGADGLILIPNFSGVDSESNGAFIGLTLAHTQGHLVRAIFEAIAFLLRENIELLENRGIKVDEICSLGGASYSDIWSQIKADVLQKDIILMESSETTCLGTAMLSAVGSRIYPDLATAKNNMVRTKKTVKPNKDNAEIYNKIFKKYKTKGNYYA